MYPIKLFIKKLPMSSLLGATLILHVAVWVWLAWYIRPQSGQIFLHYNVLFGVDLTGDWYEVFLLPLVGLVIIVLNTFLALLLYNKDRFASLVLLTTTLIVHCILLIVASLLVFLNI